MRKRFISLVLALTMICAMAISVSAAQYTYMGEYEGSYYEVVDNCKTASYSSTMFCDNAVYMMYSVVSKYAVAETSTGNTTSLYMGKVTSSSSAISNSISESVPYSLHHIACEHYVDGNWVHSNTVSP